jgi:hypothetical protein
MNLIALMGPLALSATFLVGLPEPPSEQKAKYVSGPFQVAGNGLYQQASYIERRDENGKPILDKKGRRVEPGDLSELGPQLGGDLKLSPDEIRRINEASGKINCGTTKEGIPIDAHGTIFPNGMAVLTLTHVIMDEKTRKAYPRCILVGQAGIKDVELDLRESSILEIPAPSARWEEAAVVVMLMNRRVDIHGRPLSGLPLDEAGKPTAYRQKKLMVSSVLLDRGGAKYRGNPEKEPTIQECSPQLHPRAKSEQMWGNRGDCTMTPAASGSVALGRVDGTLMIQAIFTGEPSWDDRKFLPANGLPFSLDDTRPNYSVGYNFDDEDVTSMMKFVERQSALLR